MYSLVIPVYKNEQSIPDLLTAVQQMQAKLDATLEAIFVIDGSPDRCYEFLTARLPQMPFPSHLIVHSRNYGSFPAIRTGLRAATGEYLAVMAADLQEPPELILEFFKHLKADEADVMIGAREHRDDPRLSRMASQVFWWLYRRLVIAEIPQGGMDVFGCNRQFQNELLKLEEQHSSLIGLVFWLGFRRKLVLYSRQVRKHGKSSWNLRRKLDYLMDSIFSFSDLPVKILIAGGGTGLLVAIVFGLLILGLRLIDEVQVPGYAATVTTMLFFGGLNMMGLGIVGAYVWRAYGNTQGRPQAVVMREEGFTGRPSGFTMRQSDGR